MQLKVDYQEIIDFIQTEFKISPTFTTIDKTTFEVSYKPKMLMPTIAVMFHIEAVSNDLVCMSYSCGTAVSLTIAGVVAYLEEKIPNGIEVNTTDKRINIYPHCFKKVEKILGYIALSDIILEETTINISLSINQH